MRTCALNGQLLFSSNKLNGQLLVINLKFGEYNDRKFVPIFQNIPKTNSNLFFKKYQNKLSALLMVFQCALVGFINDIMRMLA